MQAELIGARFKEKGYEDTWIDKQIQHVNEMDRTVMLQNNPRRITHQHEDSCLILDYNVQYKEVAKLIKGHWHILKNDKDLKVILPDTPNIIYKRAPTLKDMIVKSVVEPPLKTKFTFFSGFSLASFRVGTVTHVASQKSSKRTGQNLQLLLQVNPMKLEIS